MLLAFQKNKIAVTIVRGVAKQFLVCRKAVTCIKNPVKKSNDTNENRLLATRHYLGEPSHFFGRFKDLKSHPNRVKRYVLRATRITPNVPVTLIISRPIQSYFKQTFRLILTDLLKLRGKHSSR